MHGEVAIMGTFAAWHLIHVQPSLRCTARIDAWGCALVGVWERIAAASYCTAKVLMVVVEVAIFVKSGIWGAT